MEKANHSNIYAKIADYEAGRLDAGEEIELFQYLVDDGLVWKLQGHYGRTARRLIEAGKISGPDRNGWALN